MTKKEFKYYIKNDIYLSHINYGDKFVFIKKFYLLHIAPETNSVFLIRKKMYYESKGKIGQIIARLIRCKLIKKYGIHVSKGAIIGPGFRIVHPISIVITRSRIGKNFTVFQCCTVGEKKLNTGMIPEIGDNVTLYANSAIIGDVKVGNDVSIAAGSILINDAIESGLYAGQPAKLKK